MMLLSHGESIMPTRDKWEDQVSGLLKAELKRHNVTYAQLVDKLAAIGIEESEPNVRNKLARGKFSAAFLVQCLTALGLENLRLH
jgi:3-mercaptopyruvate sulfurtransferase SseA